MLIVEGAEGRHAATVRRLRAGEAVDLTDGAGLLVHAAVESSGPDRLVVRVQQVAHPPRPEPRLVVVQALAKGDRGELAVELLTEVGVEEIVPWAAERSVVRWSGERGGRAAARWQSTAREAAKQSRRPWWPVIGAAVDLAGLTARVRAAAVALVLDPAADAPLAGVPLPAAGEVLLVVGPEGGIAPSELAALQAVGGTRCRLGDSVLRTSTAGAVAAGVVSAGTSRWRPRT